MSKMDTFAKHQNFSIHFSIKIKKLGQKFCDEKSKSTEKSNFTLKNHNFRKHFGQKYLDQNFDQKSKF